MSIKSLLLVNLVLISVMIVGAVNLRATSQSQYCFSKSYPGLSNISGCASINKGDKK
mgnify:CR=1 FL=1